MADKKGIEHLMEAEKRATKIVKDAREQKTERMKQAKTEAGELVEGYRLEKDAAFNSKSADLLVMDDGASIEAETAQEINQMKADYAANKQATIDYMMNLVTTVTLK
mmetsp:Transcript_21561/g.38738  ORF Transcript_21561/g.38738 Transcript_21561/m.38738 type:complete len:107 (-) Transcript_21561:164-484(-)|eukprot:CAMPEP_0205920816 /NCGR_PEP_ID=MMETSP1325-20131115/11802_1 /ASSEMBLY_ACC=CAM_ASM_000708 /TAXON_ID=236786 /ORGANISM="Florenciella sp., Strain RCC1007" /LENGTH=106 /DNA_ID=CAMNT_0053288545 /DNA_START=89 /DNA_END=409 /DNA_ORIENTATION=-